MRRVRLIYNRTAGKETIERMLPRILERLEGYGLETSCHATRCPGDAERAAEEAVKRGFDIVVVAGGDGTVHEVINGLAPASERPRLGILPCGTSNDLARALHIPKDLLKACDIIGDGFFHPMDIGRVQGKFFINVAAAGWLTEVTYRVPSRLKTLLGQAAYYAKGLERMNHLMRPFQVRMVSPEREVSEEVVLFLVANSSSVGGFDQLVPKADLADGKLDVLVVRKTGLPHLIQLFGSVLKGEHLNDERILYFQTDQLSVFPEEPMKLNLDGEWGGDLSGRFQALPGWIDVFCGKREKPIPFEH
ncbi:YegS/Rv2252/BmrU family lipid kinase [Paludifilum halophilum]|uniref:Lipid kinase n=1 Tax=Paludifilum halophilum TaxID=1642702 RepID=A0A235B4X9_9BACL|nr:YegS/Rv2252/BmrU family lipid kinase [Paludifilum halophilum]OYD06947.1 lipid kinase [Paludifilum halophilum]